MSDEPDGLSPELKALMSEVAGEPESDEPVAEEPTLTEDSVDALPNAGDAILDSPHPLEPSGGLSEGGPATEPEPSPYMENLSDYVLYINLQMSGGVLC